jgi:multiple sugar transport system substrate-binding protein
MVRKKGLSRRELLRVGVVAAGSVCLGSAAAGCVATPAAPVVEEKATEVTQVTPTPVSGLITIRWGMYGSPQWTPIFEEMFADFMSKYPNIVIAAEWAPYDVWVQRVQTQLAANTLPDITICDWDEFYDRIHAGVQIPLDDYIERDNVPKENWYPAAVDQATIDGKQYGMPLGLLSIVTFYHVDAFQAAGLDLPNEDWTWDDVYANAKLLTKTDASGKTEFWGMLAPTWVEGPALAGILSAGGSGLVSADYTKATVNEPVAVEFLQRAVDAILKDGIAPRAQDVAGIGDPFDAGKIAIAVQPSWMIYWHRNIESFKYDMTFVPKDSRTGKRVTPVYGGWFVIAKNSQHKEEAWKLLNTGLSPAEDNETAKKLMAGYGCHFPVKWATKEDWFLRGVPQRPEHWQVCFENLAYGVATPRLWGFREWRVKLQQEFDAAIAGEISVKEALDNAAAAIQEIIDRGPA